MLNYHPQAVFTVTLGSLVENGFDLGLNEYPIFDENYRTALNDKIEAHYWFREIGQETPGMFKFFMNRKMNEIMPYYNDLYRTALKDFDLLNNVDLTTKHNASAQSSSTRTGAHHDSSASTGAATNESDSTARTLGSVTPQAQLAGHEDYATNLTDTTSNATGASKTSEDSTRTVNETDEQQAATTDEYVQHVAGRSGVLASDAILRARQTIINIDLMILNDLAPLFMGVYSDYANYL